MKAIDFRSDTVTLPTEGMKEAMLNAPLGDDVFSEDPTVNRLESHLAECFGKEAALFCASGTLTNQLAIMGHTSPGGEVICHVESHVYKYEGGGIGRNSLCSVKLLHGNRGRIEAHQLADALNNPLDVHLPMTQLVSIEDTANRGGGAVYDLNEIAKIRTFCDAHKLPLHLDGARVYNALAVNKCPPLNYGKYYDSISICLSKGLGAPVGSVLIGTKDFIQKARRNRKVMGGGMRQAGMLAAAGLYALEHHVERLQEDHLHARALETCLHEQAWIDHCLPVETNIVVAVLKEPNSRDTVIATLANKGIRCMAFGPGMLRFVTHLGISSSDIDQTVEAIKTSTFM